MLVRDHAVNGLEVFMLQRTMRAAFAKGMYVFPGGRVDDVDDANELEAICDRFTDEHASGLLGIPRGGLAYWIAAIRECFEEAGVLLARRSDEQDALRFTQYLEYVYARDPAVRLLECRIRSDQLHHRR
jgi:8-oxo-dGTP pyrophosphatase MutT (NUDIX family)